MPRCGTSMDEDVGILPYQRGRREGTVLIRLHAVAQRLGVIRPAFGEFHDHALKASLSFAFGKGDFQRSTQHRRGARCEVKEENVGCVALCDAPSITGIFLRAAHAAGRHPEG